MENRKSRKNIILTKSLRIERYQFTRYKLKPTISIIKPAIYKLALESKYLYQLFYARFW